MNKVESVESFSNDSKPVEELSENEKNTQSEMYPDEITVEPGEDDSEKKSEEETVEPESTETNEVEVEEVEPEEGEIPEPPQEFSNDTEDSREVAGLKEREKHVKQQLLDNIVNMRSQRRQLKEEPTPPPPTETEEVDPEVEKQLDAILQKKGYAPETQIRQKIQQETLGKDLDKSDKDFLNKYPEYLYSPELRGELNEIIDVKPAESLEDYEKRLKVAHEIVKSNHPDRFPSSSGADTVKKQALKTASLGAGSQSAPSSRSHLDPVEVERAKRFYKGFTDDEVANLLTK